MAGEASIEDDASLDEMSNEVSELQAELRAQRLEVQQLMMRLKAVNGCRGASTSESISKTLLPSTEDLRSQELRGFFQWLAHAVDLSDLQIFEVDFQGPIGGRLVQFHTVAQWPLESIAGLHLTAPLEHREALETLLLSTRNTGKVDTCAMLHFLSWDLIPCHFAAHGAPEPSVLLSQRTSEQGILIASWPTQEDLQLSHSCSFSLQLGERVELEYEGQIYRGTLSAVDFSHLMASVRCDADPPGVMTVTPLSQVRRVLECPEWNGAFRGSNDEGALQPSGTWHRRTRSSAL